MPQRILLIVGGGVAAFKALETARRLIADGLEVETVLTPAAREFITPLSFAALTGQKAHTELFELSAEVEMGHIELSRSADLILVAPATADLMAKMAHGLANDLASTVLLATDTPVLIAPAMNVRMWTHPATRRNLATLREDGVAVAGPEAGAMACGEFGPGRLAEPEEIVAAVRAALADAPPKRSLRASAPDAPTAARGPLTGPLFGAAVLVTSGPTHEPIDPVRYIANRSSGRQGVAIGEALAALGAHVIFVTGPAEHKRPEGCEIVEVETALQMRDAAMAALSAAGPLQAAVFAAAVADWRPAQSADQKRKKTPGAGPPALEMIENPDILAEIAALPAPQRPALVVGFAAETETVLAHARAKRARKGCDWLLANDVSAEGGAMGGADNQVTLLTGEAEEQWPRLTKREVAARLADRIAAHVAEAHAADAPVAEAKGAAP